MHSIQYMLLGCRLDLLGQGAEEGENSTITELEQFTLDLEEHVSLTGNRLHLEALVETTLPYARHIISGQAKEFKSANGKVSITPWHRGHRLRFHRDDDSPENCDVQLDDGELANMVRCLDAVISDSRLQLNMVAPTMQGLRERELLNRLPLRQRLSAPLGGLALTMALVGLGFLAPIPERFRFTDSEEAQEGTAAVETIEGQTTPVEIEAIGSDDQQEGTAPLEQVIETSEVEAGSSEVEISIPENAGTDDP